jgi:hypothetical protein
MTVPFPESADQFKECIEYYDQQYRWETMIEPSGKHKTIFFWLEDHSAIPFSKRPCIWHDSQDSGLTLCLPLDKEMRMPRVCVPFNCLGMVRFEEWPTAHQKLISALGAILPYGTAVPMRACGDHTAPPQTRTAPR